MSGRLASCAAALSITLLLPLPVLAAAPERPVGTTIFQIGTEDGSDQEFTGIGFSTDFTCEAAVDCTTDNFPRALVVRSETSDYPGQNAVRANIDFDLAQSYQDLVLRLSRGGVETMNVVVDGSRTLQVTSEMLGSSEGFVVGTYNLDLGALRQGSHSIAFSVVDDGKGSGSFQWDALALIATLRVANSAHGRVEKVVVHGTSLEKDLLGDPADRAVSVYLPPGYDQQPAVRYPALYLLHGIGATNALWFGKGDLRGLNIADVADTLIASGHIQPMIIVMPDASNTYGGSLYTNSPVTGNWDEFVAHELVSYIDAHFRTIARRESRAIAGHDAGGFGALVLAMEHPDVYNVTYAMSPAYAAFVDPENSSHFSRSAFGTTLLELRLGYTSGTQTEVLHMAMAADFSPDPNNPPYFIDLPYKSTSKNPDQNPATSMEVVPAVWNEWVTHTPLAMLDADGNNLLHYGGLAVDVGLQDSADLVAGTRAFHDALTVAGIPHSYTEYQGDNSNMVPSRLAAVVLPYVAAHLKGQGQAAFP